MQTTAHQIQAGPRWVWDLCYGRALLEQRRKVAGLAAAAKADRSQRGALHAAEGKLVELSARARRAAVIAGVDPLMVGL